MKFIKTYEEGLINLSEIVRIDFIYQKDSIERCDIVAKTKSRDYFLEYDLSEDEANIYLENLLRELNS